MTDTRKRTKPFVQWLQEQPGALHDELSVELAELVRACMHVGKAGTLTIAIKVKPSGDEQQVFVTADIKPKRPVADARAALFFADDEGNIGRTDPRQPELPLREVPAVVDAQTGEIRDISTPAGGES